TRIGVKVLHSTQAFQHRSLLVGELLRCPYIDVNQLVATAITLHGGHALAFEAEYFPALCARGYFYFNRSVESWHFYRCAECCIGEIQEKFEDEVLPIALQLFMRFFVDADQEVAVGSSVTPGITFAAHRK